MMPVSPATSASRPGAASRKRVFASIAVPVLVGACTAFLFASPGAHTGLSGEENTRLSSPRAPQNKTRVAVPNSRADGPTQPASAATFPAIRTDGDEGRRHASVAVSQRIAEQLSAAADESIASLRHIPTALQQMRRYLTRPIAGWPTARQTSAASVAWFTSRHASAVSTAPDERTPAVESHPVTGNGVSAESISQRDGVRLNVDLAHVNRSSTAYSRFKSWVDQGVSGSPGYAFQAADAAIMYLITRDTRYCALGVNLVEAQVVDAESAISAGRTPEVAGDSYLDVGPMISDLAHVYQACNAQMTASQRQRWTAYAEQAVWNVWNYQSARWGSRSVPWSGWSVDNPGNNYHYSFIEATMTWALASGSRTWFNLLATDKMPAIGVYFASMPGGGSLEGTGYGTAQSRLFSLYLLWAKSTGMDASLTNTHASNSVRYWVHATVPSRDQFAPIGDQARSSSPDLYDYHRHLVLAARSLSFDPAVRDMASWWLQNISVPQMGQGSNFRYDALLPAGSAAQVPQELHYVAQGTGHVFARTGWDTGAMWMSFVAGPYNESHAHQDQGSFSLFSRGSWLAVTENIWSDSGINQDTAVHNVLRFERATTGGSQCGGASSERIVPQCTPTTSTSTVSADSAGNVTINANLTPAYRNNPAVGSWTRRILFSGRKMNVLDNFSLGSGTTAYFQVNVPTQPTIVNAQTVDVGGLRIRVLRPSNPTITLKNWATTSGFNSGWRVDISGSATTYEVELSER